MVFKGISPARVQTIVSNKYCHGRIPSADWKIGKGQEAAQLAIQSDADHCFIFHKSENDITVLLGWAAPELVQLTLWD